ncbi:hypothetical protein [Salipaludibacillus daqingensis]|uniref:hypothetical protein n=1 Tax=Salipaludibacillus daqingensis TaxID=3041001 RepID=UPI002473AFED|nr:hypothetical protein [Salipaludibacillus daqingensis]
MKNKTKYTVSIAIFLIILIAGAAGHVILTKAIIDYEHEQEQYQGLHLGDRWPTTPKFQPREYIKVVPVKQREGEE